MAKNSKMKARTNQNASMLRVTGGELRGRVFGSPGAAGTHPMGSREKLALFNMIGADLQGSRVLDAFAGSGALGIEALSRGAQTAVFIEKKSAVAAVIRQNLASLGLADRGEVVNSSVERWLGDEQGSASEREATKAGQRPLFDLILADPPYGDFALEVIRGLGTQLETDGILALSHPKGTEVKIMGLTRLKTRLYAGASLTLYRKAE